MHSRGSQLQCRSSWNPNQKSALHRQRVRPGSDGLQIGCHRRGLSHGQPDIHHCVCAMHSLSDQIYDTDLTRFVLMFALLVLFIRSWEKFNTSAEPIKITVKLSPIGQRERFWSQVPRGQREMDIGIPPAMQRSFLCLEVHRNRCWRIAALH